MTPLELVDTHAHLDMPEFDADRDAVIARAVSAGVTGIITAATDIESSRRCVAIAQKYPQVYAAVGFHPHEASRFQPEDINTLRVLARQPKVVAIGETGLDFYRNYSPKEAQYEAFRAQLELAAGLGLPVIVHSREAFRETYEELLAWLKRQPVETAMPFGVVHCFSGDESEARRYLDLGFYLSLAGYATYRNSRAPLVARSIPPERLLVETDCPFLTPEPNRGKRNEPAGVALTARALAAAQGRPGVDFARQTTENARRLFRIE